MTQDLGARPTLFGLHYLAGSSRSWLAVMDRLGMEFACVGIDLPGFGDEAGLPGHAVGAMADYVAAIVRQHRPARWLLAGHSMGAKVAAVLARRAEDGEAGLDGLSGIVTVSGSPPGPEPMEEGQRAEMRAWLDGPEPSRRANAQRYVDRNVAHALAGPANDDAVEDVLRANRHAWRAWLEAGSEEDWADRVGVLQTPALVVAGAADGALGPEAQRRLVLPHFAHAEMVTVAGAAHLLPLEHPGILARMITDRFASPPAIPAGYQALIASQRVSTATRHALAARSHGVARTAIPDVLSPEAAGTLRAVVGRVIPQDGPGRIDLAGQMLTQLGGPGDGWRPASLPPDVTAWRRGLRTVEGQPGGFAGCGAEQQDAVLARVSSGEADAVADGLDPQALRAWFEDVRSEAVRLAIGHPAFMARMGYSGIAYGGDGANKPGFTALGIGEREPWEPLPR